MSGGIFQPTVDDLDIEDFRRNPLLCYLCNEQFEEPCLLSCYHSFCTRCLRGRASDGKMVCPLCGLVTEVSDMVPPTDPLLKFLVESSVEEQVLCANCDKHVLLQADSGMFFCNTCNQPLCVTCREDTHKAKMFQKHDVVKMSKRTKDIHKKCTLHGEPYIMFCKQKKTMLCINCFRDTSIEMRSHCIDLDSAYNQGCKKLDQAVQQIRQLQNSVHDGIVLLRNLRDELRKNLVSEKEAINDLYESLQEKILHKKNDLLQGVDRQYENREHVFKEQLTALNSLLPTLHLNLVTCTVFSSSANKFEFLDLAYVLINRLQDIANLPHPIHPSQGSSFHTDFKLEFARCIESLIPLRSLSYPKDPSYSAHSYAHKPRSNNNSNSGKRLEGSPAPSIGSYGYSNGFRRNGTSKVMFVEARGAFAEHCKEVDGKYKEIMQQFEGLKCRVQELQRDLTLRRCLMKKDSVDLIVKECQAFGVELSSHLDTLEHKQPLLEKHWEETCQMISDEQEIYQAQLNDTMRLRVENEHVIAIAKQLEPFIKTIADVTQRLAPKLSTAKRQGDNDVMSMLLEQINTMQPDSQHRVEAIQAAQEDRDFINAKKTNPMDDALIKTKGLLKAAHRDSEGNRLSDPWLDHTVDGLPLGRVLDSGDVAPRSKTTSTSSSNICDKNSDDDDDDDDNEDEEDDGDKSCSSEHDVGENDLDEESSEVSTSSPRNCEKLESCNRKDTSEIPVEELSSNFQEDEDSDSEKVLNSPEKSSDALTSNLKNSEKLESCNKKDTSEIPSENLSENLKNGEGSETEKVLDSPENSPEKESSADDTSTKQLASELSDGEANPGDAKCEQEKIKSQSSSECSSVYESETSSVSSSDISHEE